MLQSTCTLELWKLKKTWHGNGKITPFEITCSYKNLKNQQFPTSLLCLLNLSEMTPFKGSDPSSRWICFWRRFSIPSYNLQLKLFSLCIHGPSLFYTRLTSMMLEGLQKLWRWRRLSEKKQCSSNLSIQHLQTKYSPTQFGPDFYRGFHLNKSLSLNFLESWDPSPVSFSIFRVAEICTEQMTWSTCTEAPQRALERCAAPRSADLPRILLCWLPTIAILNVAHCNANHKTWAI